MKKIILALALLAFISESFSQARDTLSIKQKEEVLSVAQKKRNTGIVLLSVGGAAVATGFILAIASFNNLEYDETTGKYGSSLAAPGVLLILGGGTLCFVSIPFWKTSNRLRREVKNAHISFTPSFVPSGIAAGKISRTPQASLSIQIPLGR